MTVWHILFWHAPLGVRSAKRIRLALPTPIHSGRFWATSIASFKERLLDFRSCWIIFIHVVRGRSGSLPPVLQRRKLLRSSWHLFRLTFAQIVQSVRNAVLWQQPKCVVAQLSVSSHRSEHGGVIWFLIAFGNTIDRGHQFWVGYTLGYCPALRAVQEDG